MPSEVLSPIPVQSLFTSVVRQEPTRSLHLKSDNINVCCRAERQMIAVFSHSQDFCVRCCCCRCCCRCCCCCCCRCECCSCCNGHTSTTTFLGSGCSKVVEHTPHNRDILGSDPARCWAFFSSLSIRSVSLIRSLVEAQHNRFSYKKYS